MAKRLTVLAVPVLALVILWNTLTIRVAETNPDLAAQVRPGNEIILQQQALRAFPPITGLEGEASAQSLDPVIRHAQASLRRSALTPNAAGVLSFAAMIRQDRDRVGSLLAVQDQIGWRDRLLLVSGMVYHAEREEPAAAIAAMATLSRIQRTPDVSIFPAIISLSQYDEAMPALLDLLASKPLWRERFMVSMGEIPDNGPLFGRLIDGLLNRGTRFTVDELAPYFIVNRTRLPLADQWALWLRAYGGDAEAARPPLRDGDFEQISGPPPYSWRTGEFEGLSIALAPRSDGAGGQWLDAAVDGDAEYEIASQYLTAGPGQWTLSLDLAIDSDVRERVVVALSCLPGGPVLAEGENTANAADRLALSFRVPAQGCTQQWLRLTARPNLSDTPYVVHVDNVALERGS